MNWAMLTLDLLPPLALVGILFLFLWGAIAYWNSDVKQTVGLLCLPALIDLLLVGYQELYLRAYWANLAGRLSQYFFLPVLGLGAWLTTWSHAVFPAYCGAYFLLLSAASIGYLAGRRALN